MFYRTSSPLGPLPCFPSLHFTIMQSRAKGIADHILPFGCLCSSLLHLLTLSYLVSKENASIAYLLALFIRGPPQCEQGAHLGVLKVKPRLFLPYYRNSGELETLNESRSVHLSVGPSINLLRSTFPPLRDSPLLVLDSLFSASQKHCHTWRGKFCRCR